jgi:hypothetical protein
MSALLESTYMPWKTARGIITVLMESNVMKITHVQREQNSTMQCKIVYGKTRLLAVVKQRLLVQQAVGKPSALWAQICTHCQTAWGISIASMVFQVPYIPVQTARNSTAIFVIVSGRIQLLVVELHPLSLHQQASIAVQTQTVMLEVTSTHCRTAKDITTVLMV